MVYEPNGKRKEVSECNHAWKTMYTETNEELDKRTYRDDDALQKMIYNPAPWMVRGNVF